MSRLGHLIRSPASDFPNGLSGSLAPAALPRRYLLLGTLLLICLVPRVWMAWQWDVLWSDSVFYLHVTESLEKGDFDTAFRALGLNTFPVLLMWLRRTGLDWMVIGEWWSVLMATVAVLPLFGWIRRQFDDQVAVVGCLLYAIHPKLLGYSPLIIRDPTYWFLFSLSLYLTWRAVTELRWWLFLASGITLTLTVYTRFEGWLLLVPLLLWALWRLPAVPGSRVRLVLGTATCLALIPILVVVVNATWLKDHSRWEMGRLGALKQVWSWVVSSADRVLTRPAVAGSIPSTPAAEEARRPLPPPADPASCHDADADGAPCESLSTFVLGRKMFLRFLKALSYSYGLLIAVGLCRWRHVFFRRDQQALLAHNAILFSCVWVYYARHKGIDLRYFLAVVLIGLPYLALGFLQVVEWIVRLTRQAPVEMRQRRAAAVAGLLAAVALIGMPDAMLSARRLMVQQTELGCWILEQQGPNRTIVGPASAVSLIEYHSKGRVIPFPRNSHGDSKVLAGTVRDCRPEVLFFWEDPYNRDVFAVRGEILEACSNPEFVRVPAGQLPPGCREVEVFVQRRRAEKTAETRARKPARQL